MPWPVYLALRHIFPRGKLISLFTVVPIIGVTLGVGIIIIADAVMGGWGHQYRKMIVDTQGEIQVTSYSGPITNPGEVSAQIDVVEGVASSSPYAQSIVLMQHRENNAVPVLVSVDPRRLQATIALERYLVRGKLEDLDDDSVFLGINLAYQLNAVVGKTVDVFSPRIIDRANPDEILLPRQLLVAGIFEFGHQEYDTSTAICTLRTMQDLTGLDDGVQGLNIRLTAGADMDEVVGRLETALGPNMRVLTWMQSNASFQAILNFERSMFSFLLLFIVLVALFAMTGALVTSVVRKTREIGLLGALGAQPRHVAAAFCVQSLVVGVCGTVFGLIFGFTMVYFREGIVTMITKFTMSREDFAHFYQFTRLPAHIEARTVILLVLFTLLASVIAGVYPAWRAARLKPAEALRSE